MIHDPAHPHAHDPRVNVGGTERAISALLAGGLVLNGLRRRSISGVALAALGASLGYRAATGRCPLYSALDVSTADRGAHDPAEPRDFFERGRHLEESITIRRPPHELYGIWRDSEKLARFLPGVESVRALDGGRSHWLTRGPAGRRVEWDAEIINDVENELIAWRTTRGADVHHAGSIRFIPAPPPHSDQTQVKVAIEYLPPGRALGAAAAGILGAGPSRFLRRTLEHFRRQMETPAGPTRSQNA